MLSIRSDLFDHPYATHINDALNRFSSVGLRTLVFGVRILTKQQYKQIDKMYAQVQQLKGLEREKSLNKMYETVESNICLLGCTAIRDYLQDKVPEVIHRFLEAGIKVWMITGDKLQTAESIAHSAGIFQPDTEIF